MAPPVRLSCEPETPAHIAYWRPSATVIYLARRFLLGPFFAGIFLLWIRLSGTFALPSGATDGLPTGGNFSSGCAFNHALPSTVAAHALNA